MKITLQNIRKSFGEKTALDSLSCEFRPGNIIGLLGPNGAGKTTTLRIILELLKADEGEIFFDEQPISPAVKRKIGYMPEERGLYPKFAVGDVLVYFARLKGMSKKKAYIETVRLLDRFGIVEQLEKPVRSLSKGYQQLVQYISTVLHQPQVIFMDEPFVGLDPLHQEAIRKHLFSLRDEGKTIVLSTHLLREAEHVCNYFVFLNNGKNILEGSLEEIRSEFPNQIVVVESPEKLDDLGEFEGVEKINISDNRAEVFLKNSSDVQAFVRKVVESRAIARLEINQPNLRDIFFHRIGEH